ncbi:MAG TPA: ABC transporter ATP-binding protein [Myxococcales bacterium]|nr:ABC transporter ATP-binding protein [Myxococcales bacterium]
MGAPLAIEARGLHKWYGGLFGSRQRALCGLDLQVERGEAFGLIGPNGAGKTTFIKLLLGIARASRGEVRLLGGDPQEVAVRRRVGYLPERLHLPHAWTPPAFLASVARLKGVPAAPRALVDLLARVGLADDAHRKIGGFSKGMRQRLGLAGALLGAPDLLVLDEPTDGIDPLGRMEVRRLLLDELARGATLFLNSHLLAETERVCGRVGILSGGRVLREGRLEDLCRSASHFRVRFAPGCDAQAVAAAGFVPGREPATWRCEADTPERLNEALDRARRSGALLLEVAREEKDLEEVLQEAVRGAAPVPAPERLTGEAA